MRTPAALAIASLAGAAPAAGEVVVIEYQGVIEEVRPAFALIATEGSSAWGRIVYDTATADTDPDPTTGIYPGVTFEFTFGSFSGTSTGGFVPIYDDAFVPASDAFQVVDFGPSDEVGTIDGLPVSSLDFLLNGMTALFASDALPSAPPALEDPALLPDQFARIAVVPPGSGATYLNATLTSITVPEPATAAWLAILLVAARAAARRS